MIFYYSIIFKLGHDNPQPLLDATELRLPKILIERPIKWHKEFNFPLIFLGDKTEKLRFCRGRVFTKHNIIGVDGSFQYSHGAWGIYFAAGIFTSTKLTARLHKSQYQQKIILY